MEKTPRRTLYLLRHAKAKRPMPGEEDFDRPLAGRGREASAEMAKQFLAAGYEPGLVLCSPALRTRETLESIAPALHGAKIEFPRRLYGASLESLLAIVAALPAEAESVLLVGHNPGIEELALRLAGHGPQRLVVQMRKKFPTCALAVLTAPAKLWSEFAAASRIETFIRPADLD